MDWITEHIAIGTFKEAQDVELLRKHSIRSVLGLIDTLRGVDPSELGLQRIEIVPLIDGPGNNLMDFMWAVDLLANLVRDHGPVLVHCRAGWSRSPIVVAGYLMKTLGIGKEAALAHISARRSISVTRDTGFLLDHLA